MPFAYLRTSTRKCVYMCSAKSAPCLWRRLEPLTHNHRDAGDCLAPRSDREGVAVAHRAERDDGPPAAEGAWEEGSGGCKLIVYAP